MIPFLEFVPGTEIFDKNLSRIQKEVQLSEKSLRDCPFSSSSGIMASPEPDTMEFDTENSNSASQQAKFYVSESSSGQKKRKSVIDCVVEAVCGQCDMETQGPQLLKDSLSRTQLGKRLFSDVVIENEIESTISENLVSKFKELPKISPLRKIFISLMCYNISVTNLARFLSVSEKLMTPSTKFNSLDKRRRDNTFLTKKLRFFICSSL